MVVLVIRTRKPLFRSKPGKHLVFATLFIVAVTIILPFIPLAELFGFRAVSVLYSFVVAIIVSLYIVMAEIVKKIFYKRIEF